MSKGMDREVACVIGNEREVACVIGNEREVACVIGNEREVACAIGNGQGSSPCPSGSGGFTVCLLAPWNEPRMNMAPSAKPRVPSVSATHSRHRSSVPLTPADRRRVTPDG